MNRSDTELFERQTRHGLLVAFGECSKGTGWIEGLRKVRIPQNVQSKSGAVTPQAKSIELSAGILPGIEDLQDLSLEAQPIAKDQVVAEAWAKRGLCILAMSAAPWLCVTRRLCLIGTLPLMTSTGPSSSKPSLMKCKPAARSFLMSI